MWRRTVLYQHHRPYTDAVKPFNFLISPHVAPLGHSVGADPKRFHLVAPYTKDARQWTKLRWTDVYSGEAFGITTRSAAFSDKTARVQSYGDVIARYRTHPEAKSRGPDGKPCGKQTVGLLQRRPVTLGELVHIGKETNRLEEVEQGLIHDRDEVQLVFRERQVQKIPLLSKPLSMTCHTCGNPVKSTRANYCSAACKQRLYRLWQHHRRREARCR